MSRRWESCFPAPGKGHIHSLSKVFLAPGETVSRHRESSFPAPGKSHIHALSKKICWFSRRQGKLCPAPESSGARFWKGSGARFRRECNFVGAGGSCVPALGKLFPGAGERSHSFMIKEKCVSFPGARGSPGTGKAVLAPGNGAGGQKPICSTSNIRPTSEERCVGFPGAGESCVLAPGKLFPGAGKRLARRRLVSI